MLIFIGLGLQEKGISLTGVEEARSADFVYAELYTSLVPGLRVKNLEQLIGKTIKVLDRETVEQAPDEILEAAKNHKVAFLCPGDPMVATTHIDLRLRAEKAGIRTRVIHGASVMSAVAGATGLQSYKFGRSATIPFPDIPSETPYHALLENAERDLHTLLLLDIRAEENRALTANEAMDIMLGLESKLRREVFTPETLAVVVARVDSPDSVVRADRVRELRREDFGQPPHVLVVPGKLHFLEAEALHVLAGAPKEVVESA